MTILDDRLAQLGALHLDKGSHADFNDGHCALEGCDATTVARGLCNRHYKQMKQSGALDTFGLNHMTSSETFWPRVDRSGDCWIWTGRTDDHGYGRVGYRKQPNIGAHRVAWALARNGGDLPELWVLHRCDNPPCVNPDHLFLGDCRDNNRDRERKGRTKGFVRSGPDHHAYRVTPEIRQQMRDMRSAGFTQQSIADAFDISRGHVARVVCGVLPRNAKGVAA